MLEVAINDPRRKQSGRPSPLSKEWEANWTSHIVMAATNDIERAFDSGEIDHAQGLCFYQTKMAKHRHGLFTYALVNSLRSPQACLATYSTLIDQMGSQLHRQTPVVFGDRNSPLWNQDDYLPSSESIREISAPQ